MVIFIDIDGVLIPGRAYYMASQSHPLPTVFCPGVVGLVNSLCQKLDAKLVIHSNWRRTDPRRVERDFPPLQEHFVDQGILREHLHEDPLCPLTSSGRWVDILAWLADHQEASKNEFWILEDETPPAEWRWRDKVVQTNFDDGFTVEQYRQILEKSGAGGKIIIPGG